MQEKQQSPESQFSQSEQLINDYTQYVAGHYAPIKGVVISQGNNYFVKSVDGRVFVDFFASYSSVNQGHTHPRIIKSLIKQGLKLTLTSGAYYNEKYPELAKLVSETFGYEKMMPCNGGAEAVEAAIKIATRKWHHKMKEQNIPLDTEDKNQAILVWAKGAYHGQSGGVCSALQGREFTSGFTPSPVNRRTVPYGDISALRELFEKEGKNIAAFLVEPIQGEAGVIIPPEGYFKAVRELCTKHGILLIMDEIQAGMGRTGKRLCQEHYGIRADIVTMAKALTDGVGPLSLVLADHKVMKVLGPGGHGSTFGGNPLMSAVAIAAITVMKEEKLCERSAELGTLFKENLKTRLNAFIATNEKPGLIKEIRGEGLFIGIEFSDSAIPFRDALIDAGIMCQQTKGKTLRVSPPLTISKEALDEFVNILEEICILAKDGKDLKTNPVLPMPTRLENKHGIKATFDNKVNLMLDIAEEIIKEENPFTQRLNAMRNNASGKEQLSRL